MRKSFLLGGAVAMLGLTACGDPLNVVNVNQPDVERAYATPAGIEGVIAGLGSNFWNGTNGVRSSEGVNTQSKWLSAESGSTVNNFGGAPRFAIPRSPISNSLGNDIQDGNRRQFQTFSVLTRTASNAVAAVYRLQANGGTIGSVGANERAKSFGYFMLGQALSSLAAAYDSAAIVTPATPSSEIPPLSGYAAVNAAAIQMYDSAEAAANRASTDAANFTIPATWLSTPTISRTDFIRLIRSMRARARVGAVRSPTETIDWAAVIADATNGIEADFFQNVGGTTGWTGGYATGQAYVASSWSFAPMYYYGMADTSGAYSTWLATPRSTRAAFLVQTPDARWPVGADRATQIAEAPTNVQLPVGRYMRNRPIGEDVANVGWAESFYDFRRFGAIYVNSGQGAYIEMDRAENDLLAAEGYIRTNQFALAAPLINRSRVIAGLPPVGVTDGTSPVAGGTACVPRVPVGPNYTSATCGTMLEALKYEKRMETAFTGFMQWFRDNRRWGDMIEGTALEWPVPYQEMQARRKAYYDGNLVAGAGTYRFGNGADK